MGNPSHLHKTYSRIGGEEREVKGGKERGGKRRRGEERGGEREGVKERGEVNEGGGRTMLVS